MLVSSSLFNRVGSTRKVATGVKNIQTDSVCSKQQGNGAKRKTNWRQCVTFWLIHSACGWQKNKRPIVGGADWGDIAHAHGEDAHNPGSGNVTFDDVRQWITAFAISFTERQLPDAHVASVTQGTNVHQRWTMRLHKCVCAQALHCKRLFTRLRETINKTKNVANTYEEEKTKQCQACL